MLYLFIWENRVPIYSGDAQDFSTFDSVALSSGPRFRELQVNRFYYYENLMKIIGLNHLYFVWESMFKLPFVSIVTLIFFLGGGYTCPILSCIMR